MVLAVSLVKNEEIEEGMDKYCSVIGMYGDIPNNLRNYYKLLVHLVLLFEENI